MQYSIQCRSSARARHGNDVADGGDQAFIREAMQEVGAIAAAAGHPLSPQLIDQLIAGTRAMPAYKTSMALDFEAQRPLNSKPSSAMRCVSARRTAWQRRRWKRSMRLQDG